MLNLKMSNLKSLSMKSLSVFFPLYNEEGNVEILVEKASKVLEGLRLKDYEILLINDGSSDNTGKVADKLALANKRIRVIHHQRNLGYGEALKSGFYNAKFDLIVYTDGDGQFDFSEVTKFLEKIEDYDLLIGYRIKRQDPIFRILFKKGWTLSLWTMYQLTLKDVDCGFKMIKRAALEKIPHLQSQRGAMINAEIAIKVKKYGFRVGQIGVNHYPRLSGKPTGASLKVIVRSYVDLVRLWWELKDQKYALLLLILTLALAASLRFYRIDAYMTFLGDEGRDALIMKRMLDGDLPLIGPPTSVGNIYLGPLYYYMMFVPMALTGLNPVSAAAMNALIGVLTVWLIYYLGKIWFGRISGLVAAFLYAISPVTIIYSRSSWNPNPAPFFALLGIFSLYKLNKDGNFHWLIATGVSFAAALQMHYLAVILIPIGAVLWVHAIWYRSLKKMRMKNLFSGTLLGIISFLAVMSPLFIFDLRHNFLNYRAITTLFSQSSAVNADIISNIVRIPSLYSYNLIGRYMTGENYFLQVILSVLIVMPFVKKTFNWPIVALGVWLIIGLFGISFYQQSVYDHYLGFLNPAPFLLFGSLATLKLGFRKLVYVVLLVLIIALSWVNLQKNPQLNPPNNQLKRTQDVTKFIINQAKGEDFNFALLAKNNYDSAYSFYLGEYGHKPKNVPFEKTNQLFVVCEDPCDPIYSPKYEIAAFGWTLVEREWDFEGVKIYKLIHNPEQLKQ